MRRLTRPLPLAVLGGLLLALLVAGLFVLPRRAALGCLLAFGDAPPEDLAEGAPAPGDLRLLEDEVRYGARRTWLRRTGAATRPTLLFVHGVAKAGLRDGRILQAVRAFGDAGFTVVAPEMPTLVDPMDPAPVGVAVERTLAAVARGAFPGADPRRIGVVGISVGGALALRGCARHRAAGRAGLRALLLIGAPDDLGRTAVDWFAAEDALPPGDGSLDWERRHAAAFARSYLVRAGLTRRFGRDAEVRALATWMDEREVPEGTPPGVTRPELLAVAAWLRAPAAQRAASREEVLQAAAARIEALSPALWDAELDALAGIPVFLLHGEGDPLVPLAEADHLARRLGRRTLVPVLRSRLVGHTSLHAVSLGERLAHVRFLDDVFDMIGD